MHEVSGGCERHTKPVRRKGGVRKEFGQAKCLPLLSTLNESSALDRQDINGINKETPNYIQSLEATAENSTFISMGNSCFKPS